MASSDKYDDPPPPYSPFAELNFQDPFTSVEGGIGNLSISTPPLRTHAFSNANSSISVQSSNLDQDIDSTAASRRSSATSPVSPISRECSPLKSSDLKDNGEDIIVPAMSLSSKGSDLVFSSLDLGPLGDLERPKSSGSSESLDPDITPRPTSRIGDNERTASLDGGADLLKSHGMAPRLCKSLSQCTRQTWNVNHWFPAPIPFSTSPASMTRSVSVTGSSIQSFRSVDDLDEWNIETLRDMTDVVREALRMGSIPNAETEILSEILTAFLVDEQTMQSAVDINLIALTYFDKLLDAIINHISQDIAEEEPRLLEIQSRARSLQHRWQQRFKEKYAHTQFP
jgi:hypothetical protein